MKDPDRPVRLQAVQALEAVGPEAAAALEDLARLRNDPDPEIRKVVAAAITAIKPDTP
jgi:HEAT repeat protein